MKALPLRKRRKHSDFFRCRRFWGRAFPHGILALILLALPLLAPAATSGPKRADRPERELLRLLRHDCGSCHGLTLKGGLGKPLLPENLSGRDAQVLAQIILHGVPGTPMPPWRGILTERDALWIARKLKEGLAHASP